MHKPLIALAASGALLVGGCATVFGGRDAGSELVGRSARLEPARGQASTLYFQKDGIVRSVFGKREATGRWSVRNRQLCFVWAGMVLGIGAAMVTIWNVARAAMRK